jgi:hypothetical protein
MRAPVWLSALIALESRARSFLRNVPCTLESSIGPGGLRIGNTGPDPCHHCRGDHLSAPASGASRARPASAGGAFLPLLAVADDRHGDQGMGRDPSQASRQVRNRRGPAQSAGVRHPSGSVDGRLPVRQGGQEPRPCSVTAMEHPDDWIENHLYSPWHKLGVVIMLAIDVAIFGVFAGLADLGRADHLDSLLGGGRDQRSRPFLGLPEFQLPRDASTNISPWGILIGGEELHNNHHTFPDFGQGCRSAGTNSTSAGSISAFLPRLAWRRSRRWRRDRGWARCVRWSISTPCRR